MARRYSGNMNGELFLANTDPARKEVHDLDNEISGANLCLIDEIIKAGNDKPYHSLASANNDGYVNCAYCIGGRSE